MATTSQDRCQYSELRRNSGRRHQVPHRVKCSVWQTRRPPAIVQRRRTEASKGIGPWTKSTRHRDHGFSEAFRPGGSWNPVIQPGVTARTGLLRTPSIDNHKQGKNGRRSYSVVAKRALTELSSRPGNQYTKRPRSTGHQSDPYRQPDRNVTAQVVDPDADRTRPEGPGRRQGARRQVVKYKS